MGLCVFYRRLAGESTLCTFAPVAFLSLVFLTLQLENLTLFQVDAAGYALAGKELASRPFLTWGSLTWLEAPFYIHPPVVPWLVAIGVRIFGPTNIAATLPIVLLSWASVFLAYRLGCTTWDRSFGLLSALVLTLCPQFIRDGRNPMLEPALMFFIMAAVYYHLRYVESGAWRHSLLAAVAFGLALLSKGPPAVLAPAVMVTVEVARRVLAPRFGAPKGSLAVHFAVVLVVGLAMVGLFDLWHYRLTGVSFVKEYFHIQFLQRAREGYSLFYFQDLLQNRFWPWLPLAFLGAFLAIRSSDSKAQFTALVHATVVMGTLVGFSLFKWRAAWYPTIYYMSLSILAAIPLRFWIPEVSIDRGVARFCTALGLLVLILSSAFPSVFTYPRPMENFIQSAARTGAVARNKRIANCAGWDKWKGMYNVRYFLDSTLVECSESADLKVVIRQSDGAPANPRSIVHYSAQYLLLPVHGE